LLYQLNRTVGGSYIVNAADSLINQVFGSKEKIMKDFPGETMESLKGTEQELALVEQNLSQEELTDFLQLAKEMVAINQKVKQEEQRDTKR
jgi:hypothetical protein